jgi:hypothetical protein
LGAQFGFNLEVKDVDDLLVEKLHKKSDFGAFFPYL